MVGVEMRCEGRFCKQLLDCGQNDVTMEKFNAVLDNVPSNGVANGNAKAIAQLEDGGTFGYLAEEDVEGLTLHLDFIGWTISKESIIADANQANYDKKGQERCKTENTLKLENGKHVEEISAAFGLATDQKTLNDGHRTESVIIVDSMRPTKLAAGSSQNSLHSEKCITPLSSVSMGQSELLKKRTKNPMTPKERLPTEFEKNLCSASLSPRGGVTKPRRMGALPSYGFSFRCDERAEKRKEFYTKLEQKIHAKEVERMAWQAKCKENEEAEIKMLRKSLNFKANPMPSFYHEPALPKVEPKKIPPTRAISPKFGRSRNSRMVDSGRNGSPTSRPSHLSLDEKLVRNGFNKRSSCQHLKKPRRKSLSKLPSERSMLVNSTEDATFLSQHLEHLRMEQEADLSSDTSQSQRHALKENMGKEQSQFSSERKHE